MHKTANLKEGAGYIRFKVGAVEEKVVEDKVRSEKFKIKVKKAKRVAGTR